MKIAIIGKGRVGSVLGPAFAKAGHDVTYGVRDPSDPKYASDDGIPLASTKDAAQGAEIVVLAVDWQHTLDALADCGDLAGKILLDCNNPLTFGENGLELALGFDTSAAEMIDARTDAKVVKTLNQVGAPVMARAAAYAQRPIQFVAGDDADAKETVSDLIESIGFRAIDYGLLVNARKLEPMAMVWIDQAMQYGMDPHSAWVLQTQ